jgi:hypothetical protein
MVKIILPLFPFKWLSLNPFVQKNNPITGLDRPRHFQEVKAPTFQDSWHMKIVRLSALCPGLLYLPFLLDLESTSVPESIINFRDTIGNRTRDLPACNAVPQPTSPSHHTPKYICAFTKMTTLVCFKISNFALLNCILLSTVRLIMLFSLIHPIL